MNTIIRIITCRIVSASYQHIQHNITKQVAPLYKQHSYNIVRNMTQRSITLYLTKTPPKLAIKLEKNQDESFTKVKEEKEFSKEKPKEGVKRSRTISSDSDTTQTKHNTPTNNSNKKKRVKRQRIESSGSESECLNLSVTSTSPVNIKKEIDNEHVTVETEHDTSQEHDNKVQKDKIKEEKQEKKPKKEVKEKKSKKDNVKSPKTVTKKEKETKSVITEEKETKKDIKAIATESDYNPSKSKYHPIEDACWSAGAAVPYLALAQTLELIEATSARLKVIEILSNYLRSVIVLTPEDLLPSIYMCLNQLAPAYHSLELGIAETYLMKAIGQCTGRTLSQVRAATAKCGDLGRVAEQARATQATMFTPPRLTLRNVFKALKDIAHMTGQSSVNKKINKIQSLYVACRQSEARYLIRSLEGKLRIGLAEQSVLQALALATTITPPATTPAVLDASKGVPPDKFKARVDENALLIKTTYCECPNYDQLVSVLLQHGVSSLPQYCRLTPGVPLKPMLAHPTRGVTEIFDRFEKERFTCEWKYDGERAQIHVPGESSPDLEKAAIFSRNQENNTSKYPDILRRLPSLLKDTVKSCVLDCEAVAYDTETKQILPFQILSTRKRKDASESEIKVQVCVFVFDLLYLNGEALVKEPLERRRELLREHFQELEGSWQFARSSDCSSVEEVQHFLELSVRGSCEGLMVKALRGEHARYDIARRSHNWLKLKKDYLEGVGDTIDVVVLGAYQGRGKRAGLFGGFLLACYQPEHDEYQSLCKIGTGFTDDDLQTLTNTLKQHVIDAPKSYYRFESSHAADVWVEAVCVWEVRCADLSLSPSHRAALGLVHPDKGVSLRFPRFIRVRDDKTPEQATSAQQIAQMYLAQDQVKNNKRNTQTNSDEFY